MRDIKVRGKSVMTLDELEEMHFINHENGWFTGSLVMYGEKPYIVGDFIEVFQEYTINDFWVRVHPESVGQYTGLKDKDGKEIYEGDIVKLRGEEPYSSESITTDYDWEMEGDIIDQGGCYWIRAREDKSIWIPLFEYFIGDMELEVIGNIFENPELLKGESNV